jgi:hypothetical protein
LASPYRPGGKTPKRGTAAPFAQRSYFVPFAPAAGKTALFFVSIENTISIENSYFFDKQITADKMPFSFENAIFSIENANSIQKIWTKNRRKKLFSVENAIFFR